MTTTKKQETGKQGSEAIGDGWDDVPVASTGNSEAPQWVPHIAQQGFKDDVVAEMLAEQPAGSHARPVIVGELRVLPAFGEPRYFVDEKQVDGKIVSMALPTHGALTAALDKYRLTPVPTVRIKAAGRANRAKRGQQAAFLYEVRAKPADALLKEPRADALLPLHKANKKKRDEENDEE